MRVFADFHIHSRFSRATSPRINIQEIERFAKIKGLNLVGTGDFTHPKWLKELQQDLVESSHTGFFQSTKPASSIRFVITGEVSTAFAFAGETRKIHHLILASSFEKATQINDQLAKYGDLTVDGRPVLELDASQLVEEVMNVSGDNEVIPAHAWTPWFGLFGAFSGFDKIEECYQDMTKNIHALETGLSSDPPMNWRLSALDKYTLISNSDSHSCWPWRIGREANVFDLEHLAYDEIVDTIRAKDRKRLKFTIETDPAYGKYHWTGHRSCSVSMPPQEAIKFSSFCPVCRRKLTKGVEQRVEELADRPVGFQPQNPIGYLRLLPLSEIIAAALEASSPSVQSVWSIYNSLTAKFGNEYAVLIDAPEEQLLKAADHKVVQAIIRVRHGRAYVKPGYDGVYGQLNLLEEKKPKANIGKVSQRSLTEWCRHI